MQLNSTRSAADIIEFAIWPTPLAGWVMAFLALGACFFLNEILGFYSDYLKIHKWESASGHITNIELDESGKRVHVIYKYKINNIEYTGDRISLIKLHWCDVSPREISNFKNIMNNSQPITIKYNPKNNIDSVYAFDSGDIIITTLIIIFPISMIGLFLFVCIRKLTRLRYKI